MGKTEVDESGRVMEDFVDVQQALGALRAADGGLGILAVALRGNRIYVDSARGGPHADLGLLIHGLELLMANLGLAVTVIPMPAPPGAGSVEREKVQVSLPGVGKATLLAP